MTPHPLSDVAPVAVLSDIHGNHWALEAVLRDIRGRGIAQIVNLGDSLYGPLAPERTADVLLSLALPTVRGNEDRLITDMMTPAASGSTLAYVRDVLRDEHVHWLEALPATTALGGAFRLCHGSPRRDDEYLLRAVTAAGVRPRPTTEVVGDLVGVAEPVILCGHDHSPGTLRLPDGRLVVDPGSVGCPAFEDALPHPHVIQAGTPHARYSIITHDEGDWHVRHVLVAYAWETAARAAERNGRTDWATWLRTGRVGV
ncbi:MAG TPA: metallophosphoesterase family protein [Phycisphaerae bacterium]|nr:metallophosphoesterase family protein [Phycisphaerae bacterium]HNU46333.1 metallophosphoesterase family protein [Phycisphaerae bacterium]